MTTTACLPATQPAIHSGTIDLSELLHFAAQDVAGVALQGKSKEGREYGKLVIRATESIAQSQGFYIWGKYENRFWHSIYLGKAGFGKTASLQARIIEELKDERLCVWCGNHTGMDESQVRAIWHGTYSPSPEHRAGINHAKRAVRKQGTTHIIWVATSAIDNADVNKIEADLIEMLNPSGNIRRPVPCATLQATTVEAIRMFKAEIHRHRPQRARTG